MWSPGTPQPEVARVDEDSMDQQTRNKGSLGQKMYQDPCTSPVHQQRRPPGMGYSLPDGFNQRDLLSRCKCGIRGQGESYENTHGSIGAHWPGYVDGERYSPFPKHFDKGLEEGSWEKEEKPTPPVPTDTEAGMVVTHARQCQQDTLEEEEHLWQEQDVPVITMLDSVDHGEQAEGAEDLETKRAKLRHLECAWLRSSTLRGSR